MPKYEKKLTASFARLPSYGAALATAAFIASSPAGAEEAGAGLIEPKVTAGIVVTEEYNDNVFARRTVKLHDWITIVSPSLNVLFEGTDGRFNLGGTAAIGSYAEYESEDYRDFNLYGDGRYRASSSLMFSGGASYQRAHEDRSDPNAAFGEFPTVYFKSSGHAAALKTYDSGSINFGVTADHYNYEDVSALIPAPGLINNDDRDRTHFTAGTRIVSKIGKQDGAFVSAAYDMRRYDDTVDDGGFRRSSDGARVSAGLKHDGEKLSGEIYGGWIYQVYDDPRFDDVSAPDFGGRLAWTPIAGLSIEGNLERSLQETTREVAPLGSSGYVQTLGSLGLYAWVRPDMRLNAGVSYYDNDYNDIDRRDEIAEYALGIRQYVSPHVYLGAGYTFSSRDSNRIDQSYEEQIAMVRIGRTQDPAYAPGALDAADVAQPRSGGLYIGVKAGHIAPETKLAGERGNGGTLEADFGDRGFAGGAFVGYGFVLGDWYAGIEADVTEGDADWNHQRTPGGRVFSVERNEAYGLSALFGRYMAGGSMLYTRAGVVFTETDTQYETNENAPGQQFARSATDFGLRFGVGGSVPLSERLAFRLEYEYAAFDDYRIGPGAGDVFANDESGAWIGLAYHFGPVAPVSTTATTIDFSGWSWGLTIGHGALGSQTTGDRDAGSVLVADFSDTGVTGGVFAGYALAFGPVLIAGDVEAEYSDANWDHERDPTGRSFAVSKKDSFGAGLRVGYAFNDAALLYARVGVVNTRFDLEYDRGNRNLSEDERATGIRYGLGMELPASQNLAIRLDYSFTDYGTLSLNTPAQGGSPAGTETYETTESLFRMGSVFRY